MATTTSATPGTTSTAPAHRGPRRRRSPYPGWFYAPAAVVYGLLFLIPTLLSFYFALTRWTIFTSEFIGFGNFTQFFSEPALTKGFVNTFVYAIITSGAKVVLGLGLGLLLTSQIVGRGFLRAVVFFPVLVSTVGVGITFQVLMNPTKGAINAALGVLGIDGPGWLTNPDLALFSVAMVDVWKGVGLATLIYMAGIVSIPKEYYEAAKMDGAGSWTLFRNVIFPLSWPATSTVITLSLIGGLRSFDLIWAMTKGGPGFTSDVIASVIYKQYQAGFYGLSTAGNVILFVAVTAIVFPLTRFLARKEVDL
ncbi:carbohydrate ABC transporter permease [Kineococcus sp. SYSU DK003]|uniref:carbohydrate ABC transporter permease n=1 Tax=Kineococcus sp. SYSU DK003 TaxID=3383124 RepID=UPI003D7ED396